jgi:predicted transcriptional regulator
MSQLSIRIPEDHRRTLAVVAMVREQDVADVIRQAISEHLERTKADPEFRATAKRIIDDTLGNLLGNE